MRACLSLPPPPWPNSFDWLLLGPAPPFVITPVPQLYSPKASFFVPFYFLPPRLGAVHLPIFAGPPFPRTNSTNSFLRSQVPPLSTHTPPPARFPMVLVFFTSPLCERYEPKPPPPPCNKETGPLLSIAPPPRRPSLPSWISAPHQVPPPPPHGVPGEGLFFVLSSLFDQLAEKWPD